MLAWTLICHSFLQAWRLKLPFVFTSILFVAIIALPQFTTGDGSPEGKIRLYLLYAGHLCTFGLSIAAAIYSIWFENRERQLKVHLMLHSSPVSSTTLLCSRVIAYLIILLTMSTLFLGSMFMTAKRHMNHLKLNDEQQNELTNILFEVREHLPLLPIIEMEKETKRLEKQFQEVVNFEPQKMVPFILPYKKQFQRPSLQGRFLSIGSVEQAFLRISLIVKGRNIWSQQLRVQPGQKFTLQLPENLHKINQSEIECHITQTNSKKSALYMPLHDPLKISHPAGSFLNNLLRGGIMISILFLVLATLSIFIAQVMSIQGSLLTLLVVYLIGSCKASIRNLLFPAPNPMLPQQADIFSISDLMYSIVWKPILWFIPDFQGLNPTSALMNGELIPWLKIGMELSRALPFLFICSLYLFYFLPRQEKALLK